MISYAIIGLTALISIRALSDRELFEKLDFRPYIIHRNPSERFRFISHGFLHGDMSHLIFNMVTLYFFGPIVENRIFGSFEFLGFYIVGIVVACVSSYQSNKDNPSYVAIGASGAISAILMVLVFYEPWSVLYISFIIPLYYILFAIGYLVYSWYMSNKSGSRIAHDTHLYGALFGIAYTLIFHPEALSIFMQKIQILPF